MQPCYCLLRFGRLVTVYSYLVNFSCRTKPANIFSLMVFSTGSCFRLSGFEGFYLLSNHHLCGRQCTLQSLFKNSRNSIRLAYGHIVPVGHIMHTLHVRTEKCNGYCTFPHSLQTGTLVRSCDRGSQFISNSIPSFRIILTSFRGERKSGVHRGNFTEASIPKRRSVFAYLPPTGIISSRKRILSFLCLLCCDI